MNTKKYLNFITLWCFFKTLIQRLLQNTPEVVEAQISKCKDFVHSVGSQFCPSLLNHNLLEKKACLLKMRQPSKNKMFLSFRFEKGNDCSLSGVRSHEQTPEPTQSITTPALNTVMQVRQLVTALHI